jgi:hypothetical protein
MSSVEDITILKNKIRSLRDAVNQSLESSELAMNILAELKKNSQHKDQLYFVNEAYGYAVMLKSSCNTTINYINLILRNLMFLERMLAKTIAHQS